MNLDDKIADQELKDLLSNSKLTIRNVNFTDQLMNKIETSSSSEKGFNKYLKLSWFFLAISIFFLPVAIEVIFENFNQFFPFFKYLPLRVDNFMFIAIIVVIGIILFQADKLITMTIKHK